MEYIDIDEVDCAYCGHWISFLAWVSAEQTAILDDITFFCCSECVEAWKLETEVV